MRTHIIHQSVTARHLFGLWFDKLTIRRRIKGQATNYSTMEGDYLSHTFVPFAQKILPLVS